MLGSHDNPWSRWCHFFAFRQQQSMVPTIDRLLVTHSGDVIVFPTVDLYAWWKPVTKNKWPTHTHIKRFAPVPWRAYKHENCSIKTINHSISAVQKPPIFIAGFVWPTGKEWWDIMADSARNSGFMVRSRYSIPETSTKYLQKYHLHHQHDWLWPPLTAKPHWWPASKLIHGQPLNDSKIQCLRDGVLASSWFIMQC